jgi:hypothetical protein
MPCSARYTAHCWVQKTVSVPPASLVLPSKVEHEDVTIWVRHRFPTEIISHGVRLYFHLCVSYHDAAGLLFVRARPVSSPLPTLPPDIIRCFPDSRINDHDAPLRLAGRQSCAFTRPGRS